MTLRVSQAQENLYVKLRGSQISVDMLYVSCIASSRN